MQGMLGDSLQCKIASRFTQLHTQTHTHTHTHLTSLFPGLPGWAGTRTVKSVWILLKQETVSGSGISLAMCKSAPSSRQITSTPPLSFLQAGCPSCRPTNSVKALKAKRFTQLRKDFFPCVVVVCRRPVNQQVTL